MDSERQIFSLLSKQWLKEDEKEGNYIQRSKERKALELDFIIFTRIWGSPSSEWCLLLRKLYFPVPPDGPPAFFIASYLSPPLRSLPGFQLQYQFPCLYASISTLLTVKTLYHHVPLLPGNFISGVISMSTVASFLSQSPSTI